MRHAIDVGGLVARLTTYEREMAAAKPDRAAAFKRLIDMQERRYLFLSRGSVPILDGRHFFAAMYQEISGEMAHQVGWGDHRGYTLLLGVANEFRQCLAEWDLPKFNSCLSPEDLGTNRLGFLFGQAVLTARKARRSTSTPELLRAFLQPLGPIPLGEVMKAGGPGRGENVRELARLSGYFTSQVMQALWPWMLLGKPIERLVTTERSLARGRRGQP